MPPTKTNFETGRTRKLWAGALCEEDERTIGNIEEFGSSVVNVVRTKFGLDGRTRSAFSIRVENPRSSLSDYRQKPRIVALMKLQSFGGLVLISPGADTYDLIGQVECEFRHVDRKWVQRVMNRAVW